MLSSSVALPVLDPIFAELRRREFGRLSDTGLAYLDYGGSALYGESQVRAHADALAAGVFGNPHSEHAPSRASSTDLADARDRVLHFLGVDASTHGVCFTANATAAIKLVAESYPFGRDTVCALTADNHNSVNGLREYARRAGAEVRYLPLDGDLRLQDPTGALSATGQGAGLFAFPAQSNFSGVRHSLDLVATAHGLGLDVLLDAAAYAASSPLSLRSCQADFTVLSFYKLFGYPTGLGALVATHDALARLSRPWFAGGTVAYASVQLARHSLRPGHAAFEDGTPNFLAASALPAGFDLLEGVGMPRLQAHVAQLTARLLGELQALVHRNGNAAVRVYGPPGTSGRGGAVTFNVLDERGDPVAYPIVEHRAREAGVSVRGGCFCNPGAAEAAFGFDQAASARCFDDVGEQFSVDRFASCLGPGIAVGAVRASVGLANDLSDITRAADVVASFRR